MSLSPWQESKISTGQVHLLWLPNFSGTWGRLACSSHHLQAWRLDNSEFLCSDVPWSSLSTASHPLPHTITGRSTQLACLDPQSQESSATQPFPYFLPQHQTLPRVSWNVGASWVFLFFSSPQAPPKRSFISPWGGRKKSLFSDSSCESFFLLLRLLLLKPRNSLSVPWLLSFMPSWANADLMLCCWAGDVGGVKCER